MWEAGSRCRMRNTWRSGAEAHAGLEWGKDLLWVQGTTTTSYITLALGHVQDQGREDEGADHDVSKATCMTLCRPAAQCKPTLGRV
eukprot:1142147-Pelagomonas_calceolata.AAC.8